MRPLVERQAVSVRHAVKSLYIYLHIVVTEIVEGDVGSSKLTVVIFVKLILGYSSSPMRRRPFYRFKKWYLPHIIYVEAYNTVMDETLSLFQFFSEF